MMASNALKHRDCLRVSSRFVTMLRDEKIEHGPAPSRGSGVEAGAVPSSCNRWPANETTLWTQLFLNIGSIVDD